MRKTSSLTALLIVLLSHISIAQYINRKTTDAEADGHKGKIKQVEIAPYYSKEKSGKVGIWGFILPNEQNHRMIKYDESGNKIEEIWFCIDERFYEVPNLKYIYKHDKFGNTIEEDHFNIKGNLTGRLSAKYDLNRNLLETNYFYPENKLRTKNSFKYDTIGRIIELSTYNSNLELIENNSFSYNPHGKCNEVKSVNSKGKIIGLYKYDENGNRIVNKNDKFSRRFFPWTMEYNTNGNVVGINYYNSKKSPYKKCIYREIGSLSEIKVYNPKYYPLYNITFDEAGNFSSFFDSKGEKTDSCQNEYDSYGNITKQTILYKNKPKFIMNWTYEYY